jgi:hypothetical protein
MAKLIRPSENDELVHDREEPNPLVALAVGLLYVFRTRPGHRILRELDAAVRKYASDPVALWQLMRSDEEVLDTTATTATAIVEEKVLPSK